MMASQHSSGLEDQLLTLLARTTFTLAIVGASLFLGLKPVQAADPFYEKLLRDGTAEYDRGDSVRAVTSLRIACFGLLDEPEELAKCRLLLALANADLDDRNGFNAAFEQLVELEERFQALTKIKSDNRHWSRFEEFVTAWIPPETLETHTLFAESARRQLEEKIASTPLEERRTLLADRMLADPDHLQWIVLAAETAFELELWSEAAGLATSAIESGSQSSRLTCLRGQAYAHLDRCGEAISGLETCESTPLSQPFELELICQLDQSNWAAAEAMIPPVEATEPRRARRLRQLIAQGRRDAGELPTRELGHDQTDLELPETSSDEGSDPFDQVEAPPRPPQQSAVNSEDRPAVEQAVSSNEKLAAEVAAATAHLAVASRSDLDTYLTRFETLLDENPQSREIQFVAAISAFRLREWDRALEILANGPAVTADDHELLFYQAVAYYETGNLDRASEALEQCLPFLTMTDFVISYVAKINGS